MEQQTVLDTINPIFRDVFNDPQLQVTPSTSINDIENWDSLTHIQLINEIEQHFNVQFNLEEVMGIESVSSLLTILSNKLPQ